MALLTSFLGLGLALVAAVAGRPFAAVLGLYPLAVGLVAIATGALVGADGPKVASGLFRGAIFVVVSVGAIIGALGIWLASLVIQAQGPDPGPWPVAVGAAAGGVVTALVTKLQALDWLMPAAVAQRVTTARYQARFADLSGTPTPTFAAAYEAIRLQQVQRPGESPIKGWGFKDTARRLALIRAAL
ncbi:MAG: hypothetical protein ABIX28_20745 [Vicinamibacterales bacterium]